MNPNIDYNGNKVDDQRYIRSLKKSDIEGASPKKFKHRPRRFFVDRQEIRSVFNQNPGRYHGFVNDIKSGGTYLASKPDYVFKWSLGGNQKDVENRLKIKEDVTRPGYS